MGACLIVPIALVGVLCAIYVDRRGGTFLQALWLGLIVALCLLLVIALIATAFRF